MLNFKDFKMHEKIKIADERGAFKIPPTEKKILSRVLQKIFSTVSNSISEVEFFDSGYRGIAFKYKKNEYFIMYSSGKVGLDDQSMGYFTLKMNGDRRPIINIEPNYHERGYGETKPDENNEQEFIRKVKEYFRI